MGRRAMRWSERAFELLLSVAIGISLWNLLVVGAGRGVFTDREGKPLSERAPYTPVRDSQNEPVVRLGAARSEPTRSFEIDRAMLKLVTLPTTPRGEPER